MAGLSIRKALSGVQAGHIRIPAFQRGFVWDADRVAYLMDSIHKGYPFGALILWRTRSQLKSERDLGPFRLPDMDPDFPIDYVLDGQQRLTSIFGVFQTEIQPIPGSDTSWTHIYYDFAAAKDLQESQFYALKSEQVDPRRHFPIRTFFDVTGYREATQWLSSDQLAEIDDVQAIFKEASLPVQMIETDDRAKVAIVFERVNRLGVDLDVFQLLSAWTWSEEFDLQGKFEELAEDLKPFGFAGVGEDSNLLLRCCSAIVGGDASSAGLLKLNGAKVRDRFGEVVNGIKGAIDFLRSNLSVEKLENLPYPTLLIPLAAYFAAEDHISVPLPDAQREELLRWFWRSCFARRFSAGVIRNLNRDVSEAKKLRDTGKIGLADIPWSIERDFFLESRFTISSVNTKAFVLMLANQGPRSFESGAPVSLKDVLRHYNRSEFHHLFPRAYLRSQGVSDSGANRLANFAIISAVDNKRLGGVAPSRYQDRISAAKLQAILDAAICPSSLFKDDYEVFLQERSEMLHAVVRRLTA